MSMFPGKLGAISMMGRPVTPIELTAQERDALGRLINRRKTGQGIAVGARIVMLAADGVFNKDIAARLDTSPQTVG